MQTLMVHSISNFDPNFPPLHKAVFDGDDAAVAALIANPPPVGLQLETRGSFCYYDVESLSTTLGTAVDYFSSATTIDALIKAGANPKAFLMGNSLFGMPESALQRVRSTRDNALRDGGTIEEFGKFWLEFCGRAPTTEWFDQVEALLVAPDSPWFKQESDFIDVKPHGRYTWFNRDGSIKEELDYIHGVLQ